MLHACWLLAWPDPYVKLASAWSESEAGLNAILLILFMDSLVSFKVKHPWVPNITPCSLPSEAALHRSCQYNRCALGGQEKPWKNSTHSTRLTPWRPEKAILSVSRASSLRQCTEAMRSSCFWINRMNMVQRPDWINFVPWTLFQPP